MRRGETKMGYKNIRVHIAVPAEMMGQVDTIQLASIAKEKRVVSSNETLLRLLRIGLDVEHGNTTCSICSKALIREKP